MVNDDLAETFGENDRSYRSPKPKKPIRKYIFIAIGVLVSLGMGSCVFGMSRLYSMAAERQQATASFVEQIQENGLPDADAEIWSDAAGVTTEAVANLRQMMAHFGSADEIGETGCHAQSIATTNAPSGTFVMCVTPMSYPETTGRIEMTWRKESEDWKVYRFFSGYDDASSYYEAKARAEIEAESKQVD